MWNTIIKEFEKTDKSIKNFKNSLSPVEETREKITVKCQSKYDYDFLNLICKNMVLLYCNIDEYELDEQEQIAKINKYHQAMDIFYQLISSGELKKFD